MTPVSSQTLRIPELLAPAGTLEAGFAAFDSGADAVYVGLPRFNARERGRNCTLDEVGQLITFARGRNRRVYVTLNTLVKETEFAEFAELVGELAPLRPHAVIVQDLGVLRFLRRTFPEIPIHASTQMGVHNAAGVRALAALGVERVILERQVSWDELRRIAAHSGIGIEVFVHGALCCSRSGVCLFSSWIGGWSGNRGKCKQPCRRRFYAPGGNGFFFSAKDLNSIAAIPELRRLGVAALKIEGRLRGTEYVREVVRAYRAALDTPDAEFARGLRAWRAGLNRTHTRRFHGPFRRRAEFEDVILPAAPGATGRFIGRVLRGDSRGCWVRLRSPLEAGVRVRVQPVSGEEGAAFVVPWLRVGGRRVARAPGGVECYLPVPGAAAVPADLYQLGKADSGKSRSVPAEGSICRRVLDFEIAAGRGEIRAYFPAFPGVSWRMQAPFRRAQRRELAEETLAAEFARSGTRRIMAGTVRVRVLEAGLFLPASELKSIRRAFWQWADARFPESRFIERARAAVSRFQAEFDAAMSGEEADPVRTVIEASPRRSGSGRAREGRGTVRACPIAPLAEALRRGAVRGGEWEAVLPEFCPEFEVEALEAQVRDCFLRGVRRFRIGGLYGIAVLRAALADGEFGRIMVLADWSIPVCNTMAVRELQEIGVRRAVAWVELESAALEALLQRAGGRLEQFGFGRIPILRSRFGPNPPPELRDDRGREYEVVRTPQEWLLVPKRPVRFPAAAGASVLEDRRWLGASGNGTAAESAGSFNYERDWA